MVLICFVTACSRNETKVDESKVGKNNGDKDGEYQRLAGTKAGEERSFGVLQMKLCWCPPGEFT